jgi:threonine dehydratase
VTIDVQPSLADGLTGNLDPDTMTLDIVKNVVDEIVLVDEPMLKQAVAGVARHEHLLIEGAAAAGVAAILGERVQLRGNVAAILTGANIDIDRLISILGA